MAIYRVFFTVFALSIPVTTLAVAGRLVWAAVQALRTRRFKLAALSGLGVLGLSIMLIAVALRALRPLRVTLRSRKVPATFPGKVPATV